MRTAVANLRSGVVRTRAGFFRRHRVILTALLLVCAVARVPAVHGPVLSRAGAFLATNDPLQQADVLFKTWESGDAGDLEIADLYREGWAKSIVILEPAADSLDEEFERRGVHFPEVAISTLLQLGVPRPAITKTGGGEGGTTDSTASLAEWVRTHQMRRAIVVVSPTHGRRYRRALLRVWPRELPPPIIRTSRYNPFRADTWWRSRRTLREGLVELEKLGFDYLAHPL